jgi:hypothetical protein
MANQNPNKDGLVQQSAKWQHLPTVAIRVPETFRDRLLSTARSWDAGETEQEPVQMKKVGMVEFRPTATLDDCLTALDRAFGGIGGMGTIVKAAMGMCSKDQQFELRLWLYGYRDGAKTTAIGALEQCDDQEIAELFKQFYGNDLTIALAELVPQFGARVVVMDALEQCEDRERSKVMEAIASELEAPSLEWVIGQLQKRLDAEREAANL